MSNVDKWKNILKLGVFFVLLVKFNCSFLRFVRCFFCDVGCFVIYFFFVVRSY